MDQLGGDAPFHSSVLANAPTPLVVVDPDGLVMYGNRALEQLTGLQLDTALGTQVLDHIHPDDHQWVAESFIGLVTEHLADRFGEGSAWAPIYCRMIDGDGNVVPIEVTGSGGVLDADVEGVIYEIRPAWERYLIDRILAGVATGAPLAELLSLTVQMVAAPPLELQAAALRRDRRTNTFQVVASTSTVLADGLGQLDGSVPWDTPAHEPVASPATAIGSGPLEEAGYLSLWHLSVGRDDRFTLVVATETPDASTIGVVNRLGRARQLADVLLLRAQTDRSLTRAAQRDPLTGALNRLGLEEAATARCEEPGVCSAVYVDLDGFKPVNDRYGHAAGDRVLEAVADRLRASTRSDDLVGRLGGDEFVIVPVTVDDRETAEQSARGTAARILDVLSEPVMVDGTAVDIAASVGVAVAPTPTSLEELLAHADGAMYSAKRAGGGTIRSASA